MSLISSYISKLYWSQVVQIIYDLYTEFPFCKFFLDVRLNKILSLSDISMTCGVPDSVSGLCVIENVHFVATAWLSKMVFFFFKWVNEITLYSDDTYHEEGCCATQTILIITHLPKPSWLFLLCYMTFVTSSQCWDKSFPFRKGNAPFWADTLCDLWY